MKERPILFKDDMVRAILGGQKTVTRRVVKAPQIPEATTEFEGSADHAFSAVAQRHRRWGFCVFGETERDVADQLASYCPYGKPGDRLWVRESHAQVFEVDIPEGRPRGPFGAAGSPGRPDWKSRYVYRADGEMPNVQWHHVGDSQPVRWTPSIHMPRLASRILLEVTAVRVERLQDISEAQALAEGIERPEDIHDVDVWDGVEREMFNAMNQPAAQFRRLWESINGAGSWSVNPWIWAVKFKRLEVARG